MAVDFEPHPAGLSSKNSKLLAHASLIAYSDEPACMAWANANGFDESKFFSATNDFMGVDTQGFVARDQNILLIAFRGTQPSELTDWITDAKAVPETWGYPAGHVHKGFYEALRAVWPLNGEATLPQWLMNRGNRAVWITGHSLGGALAEVCAAEAAFVAHLPVDGVYTFGQPRVGTEGFAQAVQPALGARIFRYVHDRDIVPRVPLFGMGFRHYGSLVTLLANKPPAVAPSCVENAMAALRFAFGALDKAPIDEAAEIAKAVVSAGLHGDLGKSIEQAVLGHENNLFPDLEAILQGATQNITDHSMENGYLPLIEAAA